MRLHHQQGSKLAPLRRCGCQPHGSGVCSLLSPAPEDVSLFSLEAFAAVPSGNKLSVYFSTKVLSGNVCGLDPVVSHRLSAWLGFTLDGAHPTILNLSCVCPMA
jgi:hypothetical protein